MFYDVTLFQISFNKIAMNTIHYLQVVTADIIEAIDNTDNYRRMNIVEKYL